MMNLGHRQQEPDPVDLDGGVSLLTLLASALTLADVADRLNVSLRQVQGYVDDGSLVAVDVGRGEVRQRLRVLESDFEGFLVRRRTKAPKVSAFEAPKDARPTPLPAKPTFEQRRAARIARKAR